MLSKYSLSKNIDEKNTKKAFNFVKEKVPADHNYYQCVSKYSNYKHTAYNLRSCENRPGLAYFLMGSWPIFTILIRPVHHRWVGHLLIFSLTVRSDPWPGPNCGVGRGGWVKIMNRQFGHRRGMFSKHLVPKPPVNKP